MANLTLAANLLALSKFLHLFFSVLWIGLLYFLYFVQLPHHHQHSQQTLISYDAQWCLRFFGWFRWSAMGSWVFGWIIFVLKYFRGNLLLSDEGHFTGPAYWILIGMSLGSFLWFLTWFLIWPGYARLIQYQEKGQEDPHQSKIIKRMNYTIRLSAFLSGPLLFIMIMPNNYFSFNFPTLSLVSLIGFGLIAILTRMFGADSASLFPKIFGRTPHKTDTPDAPSKEQDSN